MLDELGSAGHLQPLPDRLGGGVLDAVPDVQALQLPGRRLRPAGHPLAEGHQGQGRGAPPVPPLHRHRPDHPRVLRARDARDVNGHEQAPLPGVSMRYTFDDADAPTHQEAPVLRDARHARHLARRLEGRRRARADVAASATSTRTLAALPHRRGPRPRRTTSPTEQPEKLQGADRRLVRGGREVRRAAARRSLPDRDHQRPAAAARAAAEHVHLLPGHGRGAGVGRRPTCAAARTRSWPRSSIDHAGRRGRDLRPRLAVRRPRAVHQGPEALVRLQLPRHPARAAVRLRARSSPASTCSAWSSPRSAWASTASRSARRSSTSTTRSSRPARCGRRSAVHAVRRRAVHRARLGDAVERRVQVARTASPAGRSTRSRSTSATTSTSTSSGTPRRCSPASSHGRDRSRADDRADDGRARTRITSSTTPRHPTRRRRRPRPRRAAGRSAARRR